QGPPLALGQLEVLLAGARRVHRHAEQPPFLVAGVVPAWLAGVVGAAPVLDDRQGADTAMHAAAVTLAARVARRGVALDGLHAAPAEHLLDEADVAEREPHHVTRLEPVLADDAALT